MTNKLLYAAESWTAVYKAFEQVNFSSYDFDSVKQSLLDYLKLNYPENFNDYIESSELIALIELFAYVAEQNAYRMDMIAHENLLPSARRKQSILKLVNLISYTASRNLPLRGFVKLTGVSCSEELLDSQGNNITNRRVKWADANNPLWKEQFQLVMNRLLVTQLGDPFKSVQVDDVVLQQHEVLNLLESEADGTSFQNGVLKLNVDVNGQEYKFELVPADIDENGAFERAPNPAKHFSLLYSDDGYGDASEMTGFLMYLKQGTLQRLNYAFTSLLPNRVIDIDLPNVNDIDVWLHELDEEGNTAYTWEQVSAVNGSNLAFNTIADQKKFEVETRENDQIRLVFGSGDYAEIPYGRFNIWVRTSTSGNATISKSAIQERDVTFAYVSKQGKRETCTFTFSLTSALQNSSEAEDIEHIRQAAPAGYYAQDRMVNGQDYNSFPLQDPSILKLKSVNRTFAGQPKHVEWNDASTKYQNVKLFGDDGRLFFDIDASSLTVKSSSRTLLDNVIEPSLSQAGVYNLISFAYSQSTFPLNIAYVRPRVKFIEDNSLGILEKTMLQGALDRHWYGEPSKTVYLGPDLTESTTPLTLYGVVGSDTNLRAYDPTLKLVTEASGAYTLVSWPGNVAGLQSYVAKQKRFGLRFETARAFESQLVINPITNSTLSSLDELPTTAVNQAGAADVYTIEVLDSDAGTFSVHSKLYGMQPLGVVGENYTNGFITFKLGFPSSAASTALVPGDAFIINVTAVGSVLTPFIYKRNLLGKFTLIDESILPINAEAGAYDPASDSTSWVLIIERNDALDGSLDSWRVTTRNYKLSFESPTSKFWYNSDSYIVDPETKKRVFDTVKVLKSNLTADGTKALGKDHKYRTVGSFINADGSLNDSTLLLTPTVDDESEVAADGRPFAPFLFLDFVPPTSYVYFKRESTGKLTPVPKTAYLESLTYVNDEAGSIVRKRGREALDFVWVHYADQESLIDPAPSNIIDMFVLTRGYYARLLEYVQGITDVAPTPPTPFELRSTYRNVLSNKMISDTAVLHPAKVKLLFGSKALPELRAKLKIIKTASSRLANDQLRIKVLDIVDSFFAIDSLEFGQSFYTTALQAAIHKQLPLDVATVVLVPEFPTNYYGDLMQVTAAEDELLMSALELKDVMIIESLDRATLRQK